MRAVHAHIRASTKQQTRANQETNDTDRHVAVRGTLMRRHYAMHDWALDAQAPFAVGAGQSGALHRLHGETA